MGKFLGYITPHFVGLVLILVGWWTTIINVGMLRFTDQSYFNQWTISGLVLILIGAYLPEIWIFIWKKVRQE
ncbi:hypothetical protein CH373_10710 [Leptospira perolatii]|uniref:DUF4396 domain-containing protein n=1 Tax=Leptospira perolatii TaxID=2023191 RepID=A0A2M9ZM28_9LEPT|nr:hypothetical protein [Leptospira perolatii]PJZ69860.1 hypothetical protein CH360_09525 [Leptospira perolatii]PJZ73158.1 hypothetical protein CH373_10710 [Leptospira perolatii]